MAHYEQHCRDCERLLGSRWENVNGWIDELFKTHGPRHRRFRHNWNGVREAKRLFGEGADRAAIVHIVRDCGGVPSVRDYDVTMLGIISNPESLQYDSADASAQDKFRKAVEKEWGKLNND